MTEVMSFKDAINQIEDSELKDFIIYYGQVEEDFRDLKNEITSLKRKYSELTKPDYYLGMSDGDAQYEDGIARMAQDILEDLNTIV